MKKRLDQKLVELGFFETRSRAQAAIALGDIYVDGQKETKAGTPVSEKSAIENRGKISKYVSRGGLKLEAAIKTFNLSVKNKVCLDIGASTGGFTDCLLQQGAEKVYAIDVGYGQLAWKLRNDKRVFPIERTNIKNLAPKTLDPCDLAVIDVSFISLTKVLPKAKELLKKGSAVVALIKPQFEAQRSQVGKGGIIKDPKIHQEVVAKISKTARDLGFEIKGIIDSPITGADGNKEFLIWIIKR